MGPEHSPRPAAGSASTPDAGGPSRLAATLQAAGHVDPVLVVAADDAIARLAPAWAESFAAAGWRHRVLAGGDCGPRDVAAIAAEAESFAAAVIVGVGGDTLIIASRAAASARGLPFVACSDAAKG